jgi:hypothetical protein
MKDSHTSPSPLNSHSAGSPEEDRSGLAIPIRIDLAKGDLEALERIAVLLEERRADDARAVRRAKWIAAMSVVSALLSLLILVLLAMGRWT